MNERSIRRSRYAVLFSAALIGLVSVGCERSGESNASPTSQPTHAAAPPQARASASKPVDDVLRVLEQSGEEAAADKLAEIDWGQNFVTDIKWLMISESEFRAMPLDESKALAVQANAGMGQLRKVVVAALKRAETSAAAGDHVTAARHCQAAERLGTWMAAADKIELVRMVGRAYADRARQTLQKTKSS